MKPQDFLTVADELSTGMTEAHWRSAVSRANLYERDVLGEVTWHA